MNLGGRKFTKNKLIVDVFSCQLLKFCFLSTAIQPSVFISEIFPIPYMLYVHFIPNERARKILKVIKVGVSMH